MGDDERLTRLGLGRIAGAEREAHLDRRRAEMLLDDAIAQLDTQRPSASPVEDVAWNAPAELEMGGS